jgi:sugar transferase EpsL
LSESRPSVLGEALAAGRTGNRVLAGFFAAVLLALGIGTGVGLPLPLALAVGTLVIIAVGAVYEVRGRRKLRQEAFAGWDTPAYLDPIDDFGIHPWLGGDSDSELPEFVERQAMTTLLEGLASRRFAILSGPDESGKSRLAYEAAKRSAEIVLVSRPAPRHGDDPLISLMNKRHGFAAMEQGQVLLLTDLGKRLSTRAISGKSIREWLERNQKISVIAILDTDDLDEIEDAGKWALVEMRRLKAEAEVIPVRGRLVGEELEDAGDKFPQLDKSQLPLLTSYLASGTPLREALDVAAKQRPLAHRIVCAVADWSRTGIERAAPLSYVRAVAVTNREDEAAFDRELAWALARHGSASAALIYATDSSQGSGFVPDNIVVGLLDPRKGREIPGRTWRSTLAAVEARIGDGETTDAEIGTELLAVGRAAQAYAASLTHEEQQVLAEECTDIAERALVAVTTRGSPAQARRAVEVVASRRESPLVESRRGDGIRQRLKPVKVLAEGRRFLAGEPLLGSSDGDHRVIAWIYRRNSIRSFVRILVLAFADVLSTVAGLFAGLGIRAWLGDAPAPIPPESGVTGSFLALWAAVTVFVFASVRLYRKEIPRAHIAGIAAAVSAFVTFGLVTTFADGYSFPLALATSFGGGTVAFGLDLLFRFAYDEVSRGWVWDHGLEARTLLIGSARQAAAVEKALDGMSRPSRVIGYLMDDSAELEPDVTLDAPLEGSIADLADVARRLGAGRVIITDPEMPPHARQDLADRCHERGLVVEAVASLADIRTGSGAYLLGQPLVLIPLLPLWQRNTWFFVKRVLDFVVALILLVATSPVLLIAMVLVRLEGKPVIVHSWRPGLGGESFHMYRLRTAIGEQQSRMDLLDEEQIATAKRSRLGTFLRNRGIDELPQLVNVLRGQMSLVGPRPLELHNHVRLSDRDLLRYVVKPGATGPWQVCSKTRLTYKELTSIDMAYLRRWSIFTDLEILTRTAKLVVFGREVPSIEPSGEAEAL